jgi:histone acetyltransferase (RNA polymerase elongator complex component)
MVKQFFVSMMGRNVYWSGTTKRSALVGFCRLRIDTNPGGGYMNELKECGLIRELHVYGSSLSIGSNGSSSQHKGYGKHLMRVAEDIIVDQSTFTKSAVIAGVGTREYYKNKCGYHQEGTYMVKTLYPNQSLVGIMLLSLLFNFVIYFMMKHAF